ncbi:MAG: phosphodiester glycosidase family protein [Clostridium sp.]|nr:phosphodiester glycosidase family protein [Clostridium sp.]
MMKKVKRSDGRKKFSVKLLIGFVLFELVFTTITTPMVLLYGPFEKSKKMFLGTAIGSMHYQWLATTFMSQEKIDEILGTNIQETEGVIEEQDTSLVDIPVVKDDTIQQATVTGEHYYGHVLIINEPTRVKVGVSSKIGTEGETTSQIAINNNAVAAINGGAFASDPDQAEWTQNGGIPTGILISEGKLIHNDKGEDEKTDIAGITANGLLVAGKYSYSELKEMNVVDALSFGPVLIQNGKKVAIPETGTSPRTLIGQRANGSIVLVVLDSKDENRVSATLSEAQEVMAQLDCITATNLDGGKSTTMYYNGEVINNPSFALGERTILSGFIVK